MSESQRSTLSSFATDHDAGQSETEDEWPVQVNGHSVIRVEPDGVVYGSADEDLAFKCEDCGELIRIPEHRAVPDHEYAENRFSIIPCSTSDGLFA
jgi:hypothetical protein